MEALPLGRGKATGRKLGILLWSSNSIAETLRVVRTVSTITKGDMVTGGSLED